MAVSLEGRREVPVFELVAVSAALVAGGGAGSFGAVPTTSRALSNGSLVGFGTAYPYIAPDPHRVRSGSGDDDAGVALDAEERADATAEAAVDEAGIPDAERVAEFGDPPEAILDAARRHRIDVVVVGDHDRSWWSRLFAPAVGSEVIDRAGIPVLVVGRDAADRSSSAPEAT